MPKFFVTGTVKATKHPITIETGGQDMAEAVASVRASCPGITISKQSLAEEAAAIEAARLAAEQRESQ